MQDLANKGQDSGRCPVCGKMFHWKLLNHVAKDHMKTLKPAHLSYKCTVCTATFGQYKLFETHVYSAHRYVKTCQNYRAIFGLYDNCKDCAESEMELFTYYTCLPRWSRRLTWEIWWFLHFLVLMALISFPHFSGGRKNVGKPNVNKPPGKPFKMSDEITIIPQGKNVQKSSTPVRIF